MQFKWKRFYYKTNFNITEVKEFILQNLTAGLLQNRAILNWDAHVSVWVATGQKYK